MFAMSCHCFQFYTTVVSATFQIHTQHGTELVSTKNCSYNVAITENMDLNVMTTATQQDKLIS
jgi:hypothetical protein